jgi:hypothetical protein
MVKNKYVFWSVEVVAKTSYSNISKRGGDSYEHEEQYCMPGK